MADRDEGAPLRTWYLPVALALGLTAFTRLSSLRWESSDGSRSLLVDIGRGPALVEVVADMAATAGFCLAAISLLTSSRGLPSLIRREGIALAGAAAALCAGGGAMSGAIGSAVGGWLLGLEVFVVMTVLYAVSGAVLLVGFAAMVFVGIRIYEFFDRVIGTDP